MSDLWLDEIGFKQRKACKKHVSKKAWHACGMTSNKMD